MTSRDFVYWLQGFFEISGADSMNMIQVSMVRKHLALVFAHEIDPSAGPPAHQAKLNAIHAPTPSPPLPPSNTPLFRC